MRLHKAQINNNLDNLMIFKDQSEHVKFEKQNAVNKLAENSSKRSAQI